MPKNLKRVFIICLVLPYLWVLALYIYAFLLPDGGQRGYALDKLVILLLPVLLFAGGITENLFSLKRPVVTGILMIAAGTVLFIAGIPYLPFHISWLLKLPFVLLVAAGIIALVGASKTLPGEGSRSNGADTSAKN